MKTYYDFMSEISADELYDGLLGYGLFAEKLPPVFTAVPFLNYCKTNPGFLKEDNDYISFSSMRNINIPRLMGIPTPFQYEGLCGELRDNWSQLLQHFQTYTMGQTYPVSRIHIRKLYDQKTGVPKEALFEMNYKNWEKDDSPENDLLIHSKKANRFVVHADISTCFPSIYSHVLSWALVGKDVAKQDRTQRRWYNKIDKACQRTRNGETHGLLIGPHSSNLLSEIILVVVDKRLWDQGYRFIRNIDDYDCYVESYESAQKFINALEYELRQFDLPLNHKKTKIEELPISSTEHWIHKLNSVVLVAASNQTRYKEINNYIDVAIKLSEDNNDSAVLKYAIKALASQEQITDNGKNVAKKRLMHLAILCPYLLPLLKDYVFDVYDADPSEIESFANALYQDSLRINNLEGICYALYFSLLYGFDIVGLNCTALIAMGDCLVLVFAWLYFRKRGGTEVTALKAEALRLMNDNMGRNWLFVYEVLDATDLPMGDWKTMKVKGISFLVPGI